jgi:energy-coupling factor transporter ATP-binding protein EcfA2
VRIAFEGTGTRVVVEEDGSGLGETVSALFPSLATRAAATEAWDFRVQREGPRHLLLERGAEPCRHPSSTRLLAELEFRLLRRLLTPVADRVHLHASGALFDGRAILAVGPSGAGKSSLALAWAELGLPVLGDDLVLVGEGGWVTGFPRLAKIHRSRLPHLGLRLDDTVAPDEADPEAWVDPNRGRGWPAGAFPVAVVAAVAWDGGRLRVGGVSTPEILQRLMENRLSTGRQEAEALDLLLPLADGARGVVARFGEATDLAAFLVGRAESARDRLPPSPAPAAPIPTGPARTA